VRIRRRPRLTASLHTSAGGHWLSLRTWSSQCFGGQQGRSVCETAERPVNLTAQSLKDWDGVRHLGDATENVVATFGDVIYDWEETSLVCNVNITDVILSSDAEYLMLTFHVRAPKASSSHTTLVSAAYRRVQRTSAL